MQLLRAKEQIDGVEVAAAGVGVAVALQTANERHVRLRQHDVDAVEVVADGARGGGVVEAGDQRVELVLLCAA